MLGGGAMQAGSAAVDSAKEAVGSVAADVTKSAGEAIGAGASKVADGIGSLFGRDKKKKDQE